MKPLQRLMSYGGPAYGRNASTSNLEDVMTYGGLGPDIRVADIMETETSSLCYRYF